MCFGALCLCCCVSCPLLYSVSLKLGLVLGMVVLGVGLVPVVGMGGPMPGVVGSVPMGVGPMPVGQMHYVVGWLQLLYRYERVERP